MIVRLGASFAAHLLAGMLMGSLGVLAAAWLAQQRCRAAPAPAARAQEPPPL